MLTNLWLTVYPETAQLRVEAITLASEIPNNTYIILHWGMSIAQFPLFQYAATYIGRLLWLQGKFNIIELNSRVSEKYSNQGTIPRVVHRLLQSLVQWKVLAYEGDGTYTSPSIQTISNLNLLAWLFHATLVRNPTRHIAPSDLIRLPELFPFDMAGIDRETILTSPIFTVFREGMNQEYVSISPYYVHHEK